MLLTRRPDGVLLGSITYDREQCWLVMEPSDSPLRAVQAFNFIRGAFGARSEWWTVPWREDFAARRVVTYDHVVPMNVDLVRHLRKLARAEAESYARIPPRRRRHDRA